MSFFNQLLPKLQKNASPFLVRTQIRFCPEFCQIHSMLFGKLCKIMAPRKVISLFPHSFVYYFSSWIWRNCNSVPTEQLLSILIASSLKMTPSISSTNTLHVLGTIGLGLKWMEHVLGCWWNQLSPWVSQVVFLWVGGWQHNFHTPVFHLMCGNVHLMLVLPSPGTTTIIDKWSLEGRGWS